MQDQWNGIYGQQPVKDILSRLIDSSKIPHAFLFSGTEGTGKDFFAVRFAQALNSKYLNPEKSEEIVRSISNFSEPFIKYIFPLPRGKNENDESGPLEKLSSDDIQILQEELAKKKSNPYYRIILPRANIIKISSIRDIKKFLSFNYEDVLYRIILISDAHLMNEESQNALLKNLEEPPEGVIFILTTPYPGKLRETIRSRCWVVNFLPLPDKDIKDILINYFDVEPGLAENIAPFAGGSVRTAMKLLEHDFNLLLDKTIYILRYSLGRKFHSALNEFAPFLNDNNTESVKLLIQMMIIWLNDVQRHRYGNGNYFFKSYTETLEKFNGRFPDVPLGGVVTKLDKLASVLQNNVNLNLVALNIVYELSAVTGRY
jgi:DNA polymerase-3 subunit delta'